MKELILYGSLATLGIVWAWYMTRPRRTTLPPPDSRCERSAERSYMESLKR
jgi:hypothetical protein